MAIPQYPIQPSAILTNIVDSVSEKQARQKKLIDDLKRKQEEERIEQEKEKSEK
jgi:hypothetical protein